VDSITWRAWLDTYYTMSYSFDQAYYKLKLKGYKIPESIAKKYWSYLKDLDKRGYGKKE
jgi:ABC-type uncharacterized transport system fused permease/ATPase subunit